VSVNSVQTGDITQLLDRWCGGDVDAFNALVPLVYDELRKLAHHYLRDERQGHTLQPTALVHEAFLRLRNVRDSKMENRAYFYGAAAQVMRRVLVDHARRRGTIKRGADWRPIELTAAIDQPIDLRMDLVALNDALEALAAIAPEKAKAVELRFFGGLTIEEAADYLGVAPATVKRHIAFARAWLFRALNPAP
jgi:RNA polymerase sigma factor (TIGR02999 family)